MLAPRFSRQPVACSSNPTIYISLVDRSGLAVNVEFPLTVRTYHALDLRPAKYFGKQKEREVYHGLDMDFVDLPRLRAY